MSKNWAFLTNSFHLDKNVTLSDLSSCSKNLDIVNTSISTSEYRYFFKSSNQSCREFIPFSMEEVRYEGGFAKVPHGFRGFVFFEPSICKLKIAFRIDVPISDKRKKFDFAAQDIVKLFSLNKSVIEPSTFENSSPESNFKKYCE